MPWREEKDEMKYLIVIFFMTQSCNNAQQTNYISSSKGTYQIASICTDGIVIGTDTRNSITDSNGNILAYFDTVQKIFPLNEYAISASGKALIDKKYIYSYFKDFLEAHPAQPLLQDNIVNFFSFIKDNRKAAYEGLLSKKIIFARYENGIPRLCMTLNGQWSCIQEKGFVAEDDLCDYVYDENLNCDETAKKIESSIKNYVDKYHKELEINKHISILKISPENKFSWILNPPDKKEWESFDDFIKSYKDNRLKFYFTSKQNKGKLLRELGRY